MPKQDTLCWWCRNVGKRLCPWDDSKGTEPTPGWTAIEQEYPLYDKHCTVRSYIVIECPLADLDTENVPQQAKQKKRQYGRAHYEKICELTDRGMSVAAIAIKLNISKSTVQRNRTRRKREEKCLTVNSAAEP